MGLFAGNENNIFTRRFVPCANPEGNFSARIFAMMYVYRINDFMLKFLNLITKHLLFPFLQKNGLPGHVCVLGALLLGLSLNGFAQVQKGTPVLQECVLKEGSAPGYPVSESISTVRIGPAAKTASQTLLLPFFDDFSYELSFPDTNLWESDTLRTPHISRTMAISPPTLGTLVLDGSNRRGSYYSLPGPNPPYPEGFADQLTSQPIDLSAYGPGDSIMLSFKYQPRGLGNEPEYSDSLIVYFRDTSVNVPRFVKVWGIAGSPLHPFRSVVIPVKDSLFFHDHFQFRIRNKATLSGQLDHWMVDYVFLEANRGAGDTLFTDDAITEPTPPLFFPYTHLSQKQFTEFWWQRFRNFAVSMRNLGTVQSSRTLVTNISEIKHGAFFTGNVSYNLPVNLNAGTNLVAFQAFDNQPFFDYMKIRHTTLLDLPDLRPKNDTCRVDYPIDSLFAYDDGNSEAAYGLNTARTFAQRYELLVPDSIRTVEMAFIKTLYNVDIPKSFVLTIFSGDAYPGEIIYEQFAAALVSDSINGFLKIPLDSSIAVGTTFWVGLRQTDPEPVGIGLDFNHNNTRIVWDSLQNWVSSNVNGTLMIRLILSAGNPIPFDAEDTLSASGEVQVWPNPVQGSEIQWGNFSSGTFSRIKLLNSIGQVLLQSEIQGGEGRLHLPPMLPDGVYLLEFSGPEGRIVKRLNILR